MSVISLKFDYAEPIHMENQGAVLDPTITINLAEGTVRGRYFDRIKRADETDAYVDFSRPHEFIINVTAADIQVMLAPAVQRAMEQGIMRPATPSIETPLPPATPSSPPSGTNPNLRIRVLPETAVVKPGEVLQLTAIVTGALETVAVQWQTAPNGSTGTVDANGLYTAPANPGTYVVTAMSKEDLQVYASCTITVAP